MTLERRHDRRFDLERPVKMQCDQTGLRYLPGRVVNISAGGAMLAVEHPQHLRLGQSVRVAIADLAHRVMLADAEAVDGTVIRCLGCADVQYVALRFRKPHPIAVAG